MSRSSTVLGNNLPRQSSNSTNSSTSSTQSRSQPLNSALNRPRESAVTSVRSPSSAGASSSAGTSSSQLLSDSHDSIDMGHSSFHPVHPSPVRRAHTLLSNVKAVQNRFRRHR